MVFKSDRLKLRMRASSRLEFGSSKDTRDMLYNIKAFLKKSEDTRLSKARGLNVRSDVYMTRLRTASYVCTLGKGFALSNFSPKRIQNLNTNIIASTITPFQHGLLRPKLFQARLEDVWNSFCVVLPLDEQQPPILHDIECTAFQQASRRHLEGAKQNVCHGISWEHGRCLDSRHLFAAPFSNEVNWLAPAFWIASMLSAFLSVTMPCKHQFFMGTLILADDERDLREFKKFLHHNPHGPAARPKLGVVLLLSSAKMFFDMALMLYIISLGVYLGGVWQRGSDKGADMPGQMDSRNTFIWFLAFTVLFIFLYLAIDRLTNTGPMQGWTCLLNWYNAGITPCLDGRCRDRKLCSHDYPTHFKFKQTKSVPSKPTLFGRLCTWLLPGRSHCDGTCLDSETCWGQTRDLRNGPYSDSLSMWKQEFDISMLETSSQAEIFINYRISKSARFKDIKFATFTSGKDLPKNPPKHVPTIRIFKDGKKHTELVGLEECQTLSKLLEKKFVLERSS
ncbi:uncharacterized protein PAC_18438 [Phialocephala subalpina]|uniref:Thioredoxin domain-containing protein n=1 Tax=Phialocephala subalpina TaxID=576137 RepID=A0A1L7XU48_9HELO|nr:uncharacterized protein PAC_18438 [Phialocephala subalpina]